MHKHIAIGSAVVITEEAASLLGLDGNVIHQITDVCGVCADPQVTIACVGDLLADPFGARRIKLFASEVRAVRQ